MTVTMSEGLILVVEDEDAIREMICATLGTSNFDVLDAGDAERAETLLADINPDLILLDWMLPGMSGIEFTRRIKKSSGHQEIPIIMLTAKGEENSKVSGLDAGVDDYVTKPFSTRELVARIKAVMRRSGSLQEEAIEAGEGLKLDPVQHRVTANEQAVEIGPTEFRLLHFFMIHPERVYSRGQLLDQVWGRNIYIEERTVDVHIRRLRKALEPHGFDALVQTVRGVGYRFSTQS